MEKLATEEAVWKKCDQLVSENRKISGRNIKKEIGGSLETIFRYIDTWKARDAIAIVATSELSADVQNAIVVVLDQKVHQLTVALQIELAEAADRNNEVMEALSESEGRIDSLEAFLLKAQSDITTLQQIKDREEAVSAERIAGLSEQINRLTQEKDGIACCADTSKAELVKIEINLGHTLERAVRAEEKVTALEQQLSTNIQSKATTEKELAVSVKHAEHLSIQITNIARELMSAREKLSGADSMMAALNLELKDAVIGRSRSEAIAEQLTVRLNESSFSNEQLRNEMISNQEVSVAIVELLAHHINENDSLVDLKPLMELESAAHDSVDEAEQNEAHAKPGEMTIEEIREKMDTYRKGKAKTSEPLAEGIANSS